MKYRCFGLAALQTYSGYSHQARKVTTVSDFGEEKTAALSVLH